MLAGLELIWRLDWEGAAGKFTQVVGRFPFLAVLGPRPQVLAGLGQGLSSHWRPTWASSIAMSPSQSAGHKL